MPKLKVITVFLLLLFVSTSLSYAQKKDGSYFHGMLMVKLKSNSYTTLGHFKQGSTSNSAMVQSYLKGYGADKFQSIWKSVYREQALKAIERHKVPASNLNNVIDNLSRLYEIHYSSGINPVELAAKVSRLPGVEYAEPVFIRKTTFVPNDAYVQDGTLDYLRYENFYQAFDISKGSSSVIIAIVDSGVDYNHDDLKGKMWTNPNETLDGKDDDNDGYIDDIKGWDFWESGDPALGTVKQDNDPIAEYSDHGTHVAGIAAANTNNNIGIAGTGYNCKFMAIKAGGTKDHPDEIGFGFQGIIYAAMHGADVINCSWGGGGYSQSEQDIINAVSKLGTLVVGAAGNDNTNNLFYPADYNNVLSVGSIDTSDSKSSFSNYGHAIDVMATGLHIFSTIRNNSYRTMSGTSMAAPMVSGLAGLIKTIHNGWSSYRIASQIRSTARFVDAANPDYTDQLGHGVINAYKAVTASVPGLKVVGFKFQNTNGDKLNTGESGTVTVDVANYNSPTQNAQFILRNTQSGITITDSTVTKGAIATNDTVQISFPITLSSNFNPATKPEFRLGMSDSHFSYSDFKYFTYNGLLYDISQANDIQMSVASDGSIGYLDPYGSSTPGGVGFNIYDSTAGKYSGNYLFSSGLMISSFHKLADNVRSTDQLNHGFKPLTTFRIKQPGTISLADGSGSFDTSPVTDFPSMNVKIESYAFNDKDIDKTVFLKYTITNNSSTTASPVYVGLHNDWDLGSGYQNNTGYDTQDSLLYVYDPQDNTQPYIAVAQMGNIASNLAINNGYTGSQDRYHFSIYYDPNTSGYDGYTNQEKIWSLQDKDSVTVIQNADVSVATASGPYTIAPNGQVTVGFIFAWGHSLNQLKSQVAAARARNLFNVNANDIPVANEKPSQDPQLPKETKLLGNYPNPFNPTTQIKYNLAKSGKIDLSVYNILGQKVATLINGVQRAGRFTITFHADKLGSGIYFMVLKTPSGIQTQKMTLIK